MKKFISIIKAKLLKTEQNLDKASADSFPASDPPAYTYPGANASEREQTIRKEHDKTNTTPSTNSKSTRSRK